MISKYELTKTLRQKIKNHEVTIGSWLQSPDPESAEIMSFSGYDWLVIDTEHGSISHNQIPNICRAIELSGTLPLVRVFDGSEKEVRRALDAGAAGVIIPNVSSLDQLAKTIEICLWPPGGRRGVGYCRANLYGGFFHEYEEISQEPLVIAMIESKDGLENIEEIVKSPSVDALFIGPYDLSASLGITAEFSSVIFKQSINTIIDTCKAFGKPVGIHIVSPSVEELRKAIADGFTFVAYSIDTVFLRAASKKPQL